MRRKKLSIKVLKSIALVVLLQLCAVANFPLFSNPLSLLHAQGLPLIRNYTAQEYNGHNRNYDIETSEDGTVYVANFEGLLYYDRARWRMLHTPDVSRITVVYRDSKNTVWVGGYNFFARLQQQPNGELMMQRIGTDDSFKGEVMEIFEDGGTVQFVVTDNNIYEVREGTDNSLLTIVLKKHTNAHFRIGVDSEIISVKALQSGNNDALLEGITQVEELDGGLVAKVMKNNGLIIADSKGHNLYTITEDNGLCSNQVAYVKYDGHGRLWGVTSYGIFSIEIPSLYSYILARDGLSGEVHAIIAFDGKVYVGTTNGLYTIVSRQCRRIPEIKNVCWMLSESHDGLLAATSSGIYKIARGGHITRMTTNSTTAVLVDGQQIYAGEPDGVWRYQSGKRTKVNNLPLVTEIRQNPQGHLWFRNVHGESEGTAPRVRKVPIDDLPDHLRFPVSSIDIKAQYRLGNQIWIGGDEILVVIETDQKDLAQLSVCRNVRFRSVVMGADSVLWGGYGDMPRKLPKLDSHEGHLHFFYALDYSPLSGKTLYRYKLNNNQWSAWTEKQDVDFLNLPYGAFTLSVQARLANGELSEVATINFSIAYPLFMRWYMVVLYLILIAYAFYQLFRYRLIRLQKDKVKLERVVRERTADLRNAQHELIRQEKMATVGKLTEGLIDRILNPMNYIINFSKMSNNLLTDLKENITQNKDNISEDDYEDAVDVIDMLTDNLQYVDQYGQNTTRTLKAMEELLKDRTGGNVDMDLLPLLQQNEEMVTNYFAKEKEQYHIRIVFQLPDQPMPLHGNPELLSKTIMSLLVNAVYAMIKKYEKVPYTPELSLAATITDTQYLLKIRDNGIGIGEKIVGKIFDPFFTTKTTSEAAGVGLYLSREIIQNHGGDISVESVKDEYTEFTLSIPRGGIEN